MKKIDNFKKIIKGSFIILSAVLLFGSAFAKDNDVKESDIYAQLTSNKTQIPGVSKKLVEFEKIEAKSGLTVNSTDKIIIEEEGLYNISANVQAGFNGFGQFGKVFIWIIHNGKEVRSSISCQTIESNNALNSLSTNAAIHLKKGDSISLGVYASSVSLGLIANKAHMPSMGNPSASLTIYQIHSSK